MVGNKYFFSDLEEKDLQVHIEMGYHGRYNMTGIVAATFQRESHSPLSLNDVMFFWV